MFCQSQDLVGVWRLDQSENKSTIQDIADTTSCSLSLLPIYINHTMLNLVFISFQDKTYISRILKIFSAFKSWYRKMTKLTPQSVVTSGSMKIPVIGLGTWQVSLNNLILVESVLCLTIEWYIGGKLFYHYWPH